MRVEIIFDRALRILQFEQPEAFLCARSVLHGHEPPIQMKAPDLVFHVDNDRFILEVEAEIFVSNLSAGMCDARCDGLEPVQLNVTGHSGDGCCVYLVTNFGW